MAISFPMDLSTLPALATVIEHHGLAAKKSLGQHFLLDHGITERIARTAGNLSNCHVIEIGSGPGGLTRALLSVGAKKLYAIEKDARCLAALAEIKDIVGDRLEIIEGDALEIDTTQFPTPRKIVANLPYNVGTPLLLTWLTQLYRDPKSYASLTLMFQKEVADRITAQPNCADYGRLSVVSQWLCYARSDFELPPEAFSPPPKVCSAVITLTPRSTPLVDVKMEVLEKVMAAAFGQRRKMLRGALKSLGVNVEALLDRAGIDGTKRAEQLDVATLCQLAKIYREMS
jgi:16S rRNA (adenine1518-N6/adenine1519-N6)-dimethyltransferase